MKQFVVARISRKEKVVYGVFENYLDAKKMKERCIFCGKKGVVIHIITI